MSRSLLSALLAAAVAIAMTAAVSAAEPAAPRGNKQPAAEAKRPPPKSREQRLDELFERLAKTGTPEEAQPIASAIESIWMRSGSDTVDLLMTRAVDAMRSDNDVAVELLDSVVDLAPNYAEGWARRATVFFLKKDYGRAVFDIREVLVREPRHFGAWAGLGRILQEIDSKKRALEAYRRALALNPQLEGLKKQVEQLSIEVEGREI